MTDYKIEQHDLSFQVYEKVKSMIINNEIKPGEKLKQEHLAEQLGISRMPLYKAFQMLEDELLVENKPRRGYFVREINLKDIMDAFECREGLEGIAARKAANSMSAGEIDHLNNLFAPFQSVGGNIDIMEYQKADEKFHQHIIEASENYILRRLNMLGNVLMQTYQKGLIRPPAETLAEHFSIIAAIKNRDGEKAEQLIRAHARKSRDLIEESLKEKQ
jgi:DNA-binding GntR family transcriptional regulator